MRGGTESGRWLLDEPIALSRHHLLHLADSTANRLFVLQSPVFNVVRSAHAATPT